jgi:4-amino-4-deoxy-L-arabinose transferase-like glycosyltransferase
LTRLLTPRWEAALVALVTLVGMGLRFHDLGTVPGFVDNADELQFSFAGLNLLAHGDAYTWSYFKSYPPGGVLQAYGTAFPMVHHWMDHPPGFSFLMGAYLWLIGQRDITALSPEAVRVPAVLFATATIPLAHLVARRPLGAPAALAGAVVLATGPGAVLLSRQAEPESVMAPLFLVAVLLAARLADGRGAWLAGAALVAICVLEPFFKVTGVAVGAVAAVILAMNARWAWGVACVLGAAAGIGLYLLYGALVDWSLLWKIISEQAQNRQGVMAAFAFIADPTGVNRRLRDGWWLLGWIGAGLWLFQSRRSDAERLLAWPLFAYLAAITVLAGEQLTSQYGWYHVIVLPFAYMAAGNLAWRAFVEPSPARLVAVLVLGGAMATEHWLGSPGSNWIPPPALLVVILALVVVPAALVAVPRLTPLRGYARMVAGVALGLVVLGNVMTSLNLGDVLTRM